MDPQAAFASIYEALYAHDHATLDAQVSFLLQQLGSTPNSILDLGCGTGRHLVPLAAQGYELVGIDRSHAMLRIARDRLAERAARPVRLVQADLLNLPFERRFGGVICLESPLAYLLSDTDLARALHEMRRSIQPDGSVVIDLYDYPASLGHPPVRRWSHFATQDGQVIVRERHSYDRQQSIWHMEQRVIDGRGSSLRRFCVHHALRIRSADAYAAALEREGFTIRDLLVRYPGTPERDRHHQRLIFVAQPSPRWQLREPTGRRGGGR